MALTSFHRKMAVGMRKRAKIIKEIKEAAKVEGINLDYVSESVILEKYACLLKAEDQPSAIALSEPKPAEQPPAIQSSLQVDVSEANSEESQVRYRSLSGGAGTPVGCWTRFSEGMAPTKNKWNWSDEYWLKKGYGPEKCKLVDFLCCKGPIMVYGLFNCCYAAPKAVVESICSSSKGPESMDMRL